MPKAAVSFGGMRRPHNLNRGMARNRGRLLRAVKGLMMKHIRGWVSCFLFAGFIAGNAATQAGEPSYHRYRAVLAESSAAALSHAPGLTNPETPQTSLAYPIRQMLRLGASLVSEGGLSVAEARRSMCLDESVESRLERAEGMAQAGRGVRSWQAARLLGVIPITLAYQTAPQERTRAIHAAMDLEGKSSAGLHACALAYSDALSFTLSEQFADRDAILGAVLERQNDDAMTLMLRRVRDGAIFDIESQLPDDILGSILSAWSRAASSAEAQARLGSSPDLVRRGLCGALAGAWFDPVQMTRLSLPQRQEALFVANVATGLHDLAWDGVLLAVADALPDAPTDSIAPEATSLSASHTQPSAAHGKRAARSDAEEAMDDLAPMPAMASMDAIEKDFHSTLDRTAGSDASIRRDFASIPAMPKMPAMPPAPGAARTMTEAPNSNILGIGGLPSAAAVGSRPLMRAMARTGEAALPGE